MNQGNLDTALRRTCDSLGPFSEHTTALLWQAEVPQVVPMPGSCWIAR